MTEKDQINLWRAEENIAYIHGWDFSHIQGRFEEKTDFPWDYRYVIGQYLTPDKKLLDIDTGGGEVLLTLKHPYENTAATENYLPNVQLCKEKLLPLGIDFRQADGNGELPYRDESFDVVIDRHGDFNPHEIYRVLKPGGVIIMQQVGAENERELVELLCGKLPLPFPEQYANKTAETFRKAGFTVLREEECFRPIRFFDVGALVWFAKVLPWEFPHFSVDTHLDALKHAQALVEANGFVEGKTHRFLLVAQK
jgi:SAM-dependent methyltransferase